MSDETEHNLFDIAIKILFPCLILKSILGNQALTSVGSFTLAVAAGFISIAGGLAVGLMASRWTALFSGDDSQAVEQAATRRTFALCMGVFNWIYLPLPLVAALFGSDATGVLFVFMAGAELALWSIGMMILRGGAGTGGLRQALNMPLITTIVSVMINMMMTPSQRLAFVSGELHGIVNILITMTHMLGQCAVPLALLLVGASLCDRLGELKHRFSPRLIGAALVLRLGLISFAMLALAKFIPGPLPLKQVLLVESAMPCALLPIVLARRYNGDVVCAIQVVLATTAVSLISIPLWIPFWMPWVLS